MKKKGAFVLKKKLRKILSAILAVVCVVSGGLYIGFLLNFRSGNNAYSEAERIAMAADIPAVTEKQLTESPGEEPRWVPVPVEDDPNMAELAKKSLTALRQENEDVAAWIWIPDTPVNYPVMQGADNDFYLKHTWLKEENPMGSIFLEWQNGADFSEFNTIVYGHSMNSGDMFGSLQKYRYIDHRKEHPYVYILTDAGVWRYEIFSAYEAQVGSDTYRIGMQQEKTKKDYLYTILDSSVIDCGILPALTDRILTLSTCSGMGYESRWVVHAYLPMELTQ